MNMENWMPILAAFAAVAGVIVFVAGCLRDVDAEATRVENYRKN